MPYPLSVQKFLPKSIVENFFSVFKPRFGEYVESMPALGRQEVGDYKG